MKNVFFTSDLHFGHKNIIKYNSDTRPYADIDDMDEKIIADWNSMVSPGSVVYILGDFSFYKASKSIEIARRLNGMKVLVEGNHDKKNLESDEFRKCFLEIHKYWETKIGFHHMVMFHFPIWDWHKVHHGAFHLHGHVHGKDLGIPGRILDVGWDNAGKLFSYEDVEKLLIDKEIRVHGAGKD